MGEVIPRSRREATLCNERFFKCFQRTAAALRRS
jgi:hypothetical protein